MVLAGRTTRPASPRPRPTGDDHAHHQHPHHRRRPGRPRRSAAASPTCGRDHLVLERGRIAERWHSERWDSLRLLTPNWMTRLPGWTYDGPDPDGFMTAAEVAVLLRPLRRVVRRPGPRAHHRAARRHATATASSSTTSDGTVPRRQRRHRHRLVRPAGRSRRWPVTSSPRHPPGGPGRLPQPRRPARRRRARRRRVGHRRAARRRAAPQRPRRDRSPSAATAGCRAATGAWTSSGGST